MSIQERLSKIITAIINASLVGDESTLSRLLPLHDDIVEEGRQEGIFHAIS